MLRLSTVLCPFCEAHALFRPPASSWQPRRALATLQKRRPSRMVLSPNVRRGPPPPPPAGQRQATRRPDPRRGPFAGTNLTIAPRDATLARERLSAAEQRRASRRSTGKAAAKPRDPMKALKMQRTLSNVSYEKRTRIKQDITERTTVFDDFGLLPIVRDSIAAQALGGMVDVGPTPIQRLAIPALLGTEDRKRRFRSPGPDQMQQFLLAAETGSGKTLAYVLPVVDAIKRAEQAEAAQEARDKAREEEVQKQRRKTQMFQLEPPHAVEPSTDTARPRAIILVPTAELVDQVGRLVKSLGHTVKYRSAFVSASYTAQVIRSRLFTTGGIDVVVSTPHLLHSITETDPNILSRVTHLVIDEADSLFDRSFAPITSTIIDRSTPSLQQLILCSATIPRRLDGYLQKRYPNIRRLATPNLHAIPRRVQLSVVDIEKVPFQGNRDLACAQTIYDIGRDTSEDGGEREDKKIVVFVNEREKAAELASFLQAKGIDAVALSRDSDERKQSDHLSAFTGLGTATKSKKGDDDVSFVPARGRDGRRPPGPRRLLNTQVLVMTDLGSRGIDTLPVRNVVLYDVPHTSIDFIHRLGRVGRMGRRGRGVVLVGRHDRRDVVKEVREGMFRGQALI